MNGEIITDNNDIDDDDNTMGDGDDSGDDDDDSDEDDGDDDSDEYDDDDDDDSDDEDHGGDDEDESDDEDDGNIQVTGEEGDSPVWHHLYSASTDLGLQGIGPQDWMEVQRIITLQSITFDSSASASLHCISYLLFHMFHISQSLSSIFLHLYIAIRFCSFTCCFIFLHLYIAFCTFSFTYYPSFIFLHLYIAFRTCSFTCFIFHISLSSIFLHLYIAFRFCSFTMSCFIFPNIYVSYFPIFKFHIFASLHC